MLEWTGNDVWDSKSCWNAVIVEEEEATAEEEEEAEAAAETEVVEAEGEKVGGLAERYDGIERLGAGALSSLGTEGVANGAVGIAG